MVATPLSRRFAYGLQREVFDAFLARCELEFAGFRFVTGGRNLEGRPPCLTCWLKIVRTIVAGLHDDGVAQQADTRAGDRFFGHCICDYPMNPRRRQLHIGQRHRDAALSRGPAALRGSPLWTTP